MFDFLRANSLVIVACFLALAGVYFHSYRRRFTASIPPGPRGYPIIGNLFDLPAKFDYLTFTEWGSVYGDLISLSIFGTNMIIVNSYQSAFEMMDRKGVIYSDRPTTPMIRDLMGFDRTLLFDSARNPRWRAGRRYMHQELGTLSSLKKYEGIGGRGVQGFLARLLRSPESLQQHIAQYTAGLSLGAAYGYEVTGDYDPLVALAEEAGNVAAAAINPGAYLVNQIPALRYIPAWFPGANFQRVAAHGRALLTQLLDQPFAVVKEKMAEGTAIDSFTSSLLKEGHPEDLIKPAAGIFYLAGSETSIASIYAFFRIMVLYPDVQRKAQEEIDSVVGTDRLPTFSDREDLPYVDALVKELLRFHIVTPIAVPHTSSVEDIHAGYRIPKGSIIIPNVWNMSRDPEVYKDPMVFNPSRFLASPGKQPEQDPRDYFFGFGRRICPGRLLADVSIYLLCASTLATFEIAPHVENRRTVLPTLDVTDGAKRTPLPFKCMIHPRSTRTASLIEEHWAIKQ